jgi:hypothetical protein
MGAHTGWKFRLLLVLLEDKLEDSILDSYKISDAALGINADVRFDGIQKALMVLITSTVMDLCKSIDQLEDADLCSCDDDEFFLQHYNKFFHHSYEEFLDTTNSSPFR